AGRELPAAANVLAPGSGGTERFLATRPDLPWERLVGNPGVEALEEEIVGQESGDVGVERRAELRFGGLAARIDRLEQRCAQAGVQGDVVPPCGRSKPGEIHLRGRDERT